MEEGILREIVEAVKEMAGEGCQVQGNHVTKNNGVQLRAVVVRRSGEAISPNIYVDNFIEMVKKEEMEVAEAAEKVLEAYEQNKDPGIGVGVGDLTDKKFILSHVEYRLVNRERNQNIVNSAPHKNLLDLSGIYRVVITKDEDKMASYIVSNKILEMTGITIEELDEAAVRNTEDSGFVVKTIEEIIGVPEGMSEAVNKGPRMYVLSNQRRMNGANILLYGKQLAAFAEKLDDDFYVLPASIHEVFAVPASQTDCGELKRMVLKANNAYVVEEEILGYEVYRYDRQTGKLRIAV